VIELKELMNLLDVSETDAIKAILNLVSPPPATRQNWTRLSTFGHCAPTIHDLWKKLEDADFRCHRCGSQMRLSFNHIDGNATNHELENLEVICFECNRAVSKKGTRDNNQHYKLAMAAISLWKSKGKFASLNEIRDMAEVEQIGGAFYLLKYIERRLSEKNAYEQSDSEPLELSLTQRSSGLPSRKH
jgi:hypothetical protein